MTWVNGREPTHVGLASALSVVVLGNESGYTAGQNQKMKIAAIESMWHNEAAIATVVFLPVVLAYTAWVYRVLRGPGTTRTTESSGRAAHRPSKTLREKLRTTQAEQAALLRVPLGTLCNGEQNRFSMDSAVQALRLVLYREPEAALRALRHAA